MNWIMNLPFIKPLLEKAIGRLVVLALAAAGGWLASLNLPADITANWLATTKALIEAGVPLLLAWLLGLTRYRIALNKMPPI